MIQPGHTTKTATLFLFSWSIDLRMSNIDLLLNLNEHDLQKACDLETIFIEFFFLILQW